MSQKGNLLGTRKQMTLLGVQEENEALYLGSGEEKFLTEMGKQSGRGATRGPCWGQGHRQAVDQKQGWVGRVPAP